MICTVCAEQINENNPMDPHHWRCLNESMWSQDPAIQVIAWRLLNRLQSEYWARDLLDMLYLDDQTLVWAKQGIPVEDEDEETIIHKDINGATLAAGDTVTLVKDLKVKVPVLRPNAAPPFATFRSCRTTPPKSRVA
ncbi:MAG: PhnA domain-containing protein [Stappiaceae bacterium]